jgi:hypothetical protein
MSDFYKRLKDLILENPRAKKMFAFGREIVEATFQEAVVFADFQKNMGIIHHNAGAVLEFLTTEMRNSGNIDCRMGCNFCCHIRVDATSLEILILAKFIRQNFAEGDLGTLKEKLKENQLLLSGKSGKQQASMKVPCALLNEEGQCSSYSARPISCRRWVSSNVGSCEAAFQKPSGMGDIPLEGGIYAAGVGIEDELIKQLEKRGLDSQHYELQAGPLCALENDDAEDRWCLGEEVFRGCRSEKENCP